MRTRILMSSMAIALATSSCAITTEASDPGGGVPDVSTTCAPESPDCEDFAIGDETPQGSSLGGVSVTSTTPVPSVVATPDFSGLTLDEARALAGGLGLELVATEDAAATAVVVAQDPLPGEQVDGTAVVVVDVRVPPSCLPPTPPSPGAGEVTITVLFECGGDGLYPTAKTAVNRVVPEQGGKAIDRIEWTVRSLLAGPTDGERAVGFTSFFDRTTAGALEGITLAGGHLIVDFTDAIYVNNASTSTGSLFFNAELRANVFSHPEVDSVEFRVSGDCEAWSTFFQSDGCWVITRAEWNEEFAGW